MNGSDNLVYKYAVSLCNLPHDTHPFLLMQTVACLTGLLHGLTYLWEMCLHTYDTFPLMLVGVFAK